MKRIILAVAIWLLTTPLFSQNHVTVGMTGAQTRAAINSNFDTLYVSKTYTVGKTKSRFTTIQSAITAASSGTAILISSGTYTERLILKNGVDLIGLGSVTINKTYSMNDDTLLFASRATVRLKNLDFISNSVTLNAINISYIKFENCTITGRVDYLGGYIIGDSSRVDIINTELYKSSLKFTKHSTLNFSGRQLETYVCYFYKSSNFSISADLWTFSPILSGIAMYFGETNPYWANVVGTSNSWLDQTCVGFAAWREYNKKGIGKGLITVKAIRTTETNPQYIKGIYVRQSSELSIVNSSLYDPISFHYAYLYLGDNSKIIVKNSSLGSVGVQGGTLVAENSSFTYDQDNVPWNGSGSIYNQANWGSGGGTHLFEQQEGNYNKDITPSLTFYNCVINYMGDDVLNSLVDTVALKNLGVNFTYKSNTTSDPTMPIITSHRKWVSEHSYTKGQLLSITLSGSDSILVYTISNHTASASYKTDFLAGKIRKLFGAKLQLTGKYMTMYPYYHADLGGWVWKESFKLGAYHGGKFRNQGCAFYPQRHDLKIDNVTINEYRDVWPAGLNNNGYDWAALDGVDAYGYSLYIRGGVQDINNVTINSNAPNYGVYVMPNKNISTNQYNFNNISVNGNHFTGIYLYETIDPSTTGYMKISNFTYNGTNSAGWVASSRFFQGSDAIAVDSATYYTGALSKRAWMNGFISIKAPQLTSIVTLPILAALTDNAPTAAEINSATGLTPSTAGSGYKVTIIDTTGTKLLYSIESDGVNWFYKVTTKAN